MSPTERSRQFDYESYYRSQAGGAIDAYTSLRYLPAQRGSGFFGRLIKGTVWPLIRSILPYAKKTAIQGVGNVVSQLQSGATLKEAGKAALKTAGSAIVADAAHKLQEKIQGGSGIRRRRQARRKSRVQAKKKRISKRRRKVKSRASKRSVLFP